MTSRGLKLLHLALEKNKVVELKEKAHNVDDVSGAPNQTPFTASKIEGHLIGNYRDKDSSASLLPLLNPRHDINGKVSEESLSDVPHDSVFGGGQASLPSDISPSQKAPNLSQSDDDENFDVISSESSDLYDPKNDDENRSSTSDSVIDDLAADELNSVAILEHRKLVEADGRSESRGTKQNPEGQEEIKGAIRELQPDLPAEKTEFALKRKMKVFQPNEKKSRKRSRNPEDWKRRKAALARERGESYLSQKGLIIPAKELKLGLLCKEKCKLKCSDMFDVSQRITIFNEFYGLDVNAKNAYIFKSILIQPIQRLRRDAVKHRQASFKYMITFNGKTTRVCKTAFINLLQIGRKKVDLIVNKIKGKCSAPPLDHRGRHGNRPHKNDEEVLQFIRQHIESFPSESSHYSRNANPHKMYLSPLLNIAKLFSLYLNKCVAENKPDKFRVKRCSYVKIFETEFNLSFRKPRSDTCSTCYSGKGDAEHKESVSSAFEHQELDRAKAKDIANNTCFLTVDLQQTMPLPKLTTGKAFYLRQLWFYNLGFHIISGERDSASFYTWTEDVANRGSEEVCSAFLTLIEMDESVSGKDHLVVWSDSCAGQNKNWLLICFYQLLIKQGVFKTIDHKYPEVGHTYLDSDRDFGRIEKVLRKNENVYLPEKYRELISSASRKNQVYDMRDHFRDFQDLDKKLRLMNRKKDVLGEKVPFRDLKWIRVDEFGSYQFKQCYLENVPFKRVDLLRKIPSKGTVKGKSSNTDLRLCRRAKHSGGLTEEKIKDIKEQLVFIPNQFKWFYEKLIADKNILKPNKKNKNKNMEEEQP